MNKQTDWLIYGPGLSALVLAERLGSAGKDVVLVNPFKSWGGIFGGINIDGHMFDAGMTNFEFDLFGEPTDEIQNYSPDLKRDIGRYVHFVQHYLSRFVETLPLPTPVMKFRNNLVSDLIISNRFEVLKLLAPEVRKAIRAELEAILAKPNPLHPITKNDPGTALATASFEKVSLSNHGATFHKLFIEPMFRKILGVSTTEIEGKFHRNGWAPLFYPESLLSQFDESPVTLKPTVFRYPADDNFGAFIGRIVDTVRALPNVRIIDSVRDVAVSMEGSTIQVAAEEVSFRRLAWGGEITQLLGSSGKVQQSGRRASLDLFFLRVKQQGLANSFAVLIDPEADSPFYRVTNQSVCAGLQAPENKIILECNTGNWNEQRLDRSEVLDSALRLYGIDPTKVTTCHHRSFRGALAIPSNSEMEEFNLQRERIINKYPNVELIGASSGYVSVTLNDHIIQALKIAQKEGVLN